MWQLSGGKNTDAGNAAGQVERDMPMTRPFDDLVRESMIVDPEFGAVLWREIVDAYRSGDTATAERMCGSYFPDLDPAMVREAALGA